MTSRVRKNLNEEFDQTLTNHRNLKHFMTIKQLNRRQIKWVEFLFEFNFQIIYRSSVQNIKLDNLTRRSQNLSTNDNDSRKQYQHQTLLKAKHLNKSVRVVIVVVSKFINEIEKSSINLIAMIYDLSEKKLEIDETMIVTFANIVENSIDIASKDTIIVDFIFDNEFANNALVHESSTINAFEVDASQMNLMNRIKQIYLDDVILQRIMKAKRENLRRISINIIKKEVKLELDDYEIKNDLFWVKNKLYMLANESFHATLIKHIHESFFENHAKRIVTYDRVNTHYYWFKMTNIITQYIKTCHLCKRTKTYREEKHDLLKSLSISKKYWQNISVNFITSLFVSKRNERRFRHILMIVNKLFKKRKFISMNFLKIDAIVQIFEKWIWKEKKHSNIIMFDRNTQFLNHFWVRLCAKIDIKSKLFIFFHLEIND